MKWSKEALAARVDALGLGEQLERFAAGLDDAERELLQDVLLERSAISAYSAEERAAAKGWLRRLSDLGEAARRRRRP